MLLLAALCTAATTLAYNFQSGDLYYKITSDTTVEVAYLSKSSDNYQGLTTATIPATVPYDGTTYSVTSIGYRAFRDCSSLTSLTIPNSVTSIGNEAFYKCSSLTSVTIPNSVTSMGEYAFAYCSSLPSVTIPDSVTSIEAGAFYCCFSLTSIILPNSVTSIGEDAFYDCSSLTDIYCYATTPPVCDDYDTFYRVSKYCYIHVPAGTISDYQVAAGWRHFSNFLEISEETAISETEQQNKSSRKIIRDGQVLILRNGVTYDMMGNRRASCLRRVCAYIII